MSYLSVHTRTQLEYVVLEPRIVYVHLNFYRQDATYVLTFRMAIPTYSKKSSSLAALDIILSCTICQQPFPAIYADDEELRGLRKSDGPDDDRVTKLWLTECCHLSCGKHFEGGGVPFHSDQQTPSAPCPLCITEKDDRSAKALFYIYGTSKGEYDSNIPDSYFQTPPVALGGTHPGFDALLFQYLSLIRFGSKTYENALLSRNALRRWEERKPEIVRSLSSIGPMREELLAAGRRLIALGQDVTSIETVLSSVGASLAHDLQRRLDEQQVQMNTAPVHNNTPSYNLPDVGSRLARGSAADLDRLTKGAEALATQAPAIQPSPSKDEHSAKRKRGDPLWDVQMGLRDGLGSSRPNKCHSRDLMPPPPSPRRPYVFTGHVLAPDLVDPPFVPTVRHPPLVTGPTTPRRQTSQAQNTGVAVNGNELNHRSSVDSNGVMPQRRPDHRSSLVSKESFERTPRRHPNHRSSLASMSSFEKGPPHDQDLNTACRIRLPAQLGDRLTDIEDLSSQAIATSSSYQDGNHSGARRSSEALSHTSRTARRLPANPSPGRLTLTPRYSNQQRHGLLANVRTSNDRLGTAASPHFSTQCRSYSSSLPPHNSQTLGENWRHMDSFDAAPAPTAGIRYMNPFESGPTAINGQMRPYSSTAHAKNFLLAQDPAFEETARHREQALSTQPRLAERMQHAQAERGVGPVTPATASHHSTLNSTVTRGSSNVVDPRDSAPASRSGRRPAQR